MSVHQPVSNTVDSTYSNIKALFQCFLSTQTPA